MGGGNVETGHEAAENVTNLKYITLSVSNKEKRGHRLGVDHKGVAQARHIFTYPLLLRRTKLRPTVPLRETQAQYALRSFQSSPSPPLRSRGLECNGMKIAGSAPGTRQYFSPSSPPLPGPKPALTASLITSPSSMIFSRYSSTPEWAAPARSQARQQCDKCRASTPHRHRGILLAWNPARNSSPF